MHELRGGRTARAPSMSHPRDMNTSFDTRDHPTLAFEFAITTLPESVRNPFECYEYYLFSYEYFNRERNNMTSLLLLKGSAHSNEEISNIFHLAGYHVIQISDAAECRRHLQDMSSEEGALAAETLAQASLQSMHDDFGIQKRVAIFSPGNFLDERFNSKSTPEISEMILTISREMNPGWRLSLRSRRLESPCGKSLDLTSLEFEFVKIFSMVEVGEAVSRRKIVLAFGENYLAYDQNRMDTLVRRLRKKVQLEIGVKLPLNTVRVRGFSFGETLSLDI